MTTISTDVSPVNVASAISAPVFYGTTTPAYDATLIDSAALALHVSGGSLLDVSDDLRSMVASLRYHIGHGNIPALILRPGTDAGAMRVAQSPGGWTAFSPMIEANEPRAALTITGNSTFAAQSYSSSTELRDRMDALFPARTVYVGAPAFDALPEQQESYFWTSLVGSVVEQP